MKAFSFLTILESLSKKLSILRTKMHSDNLRVDYESITSQLRVSRPFSHCASRRASFGTSRRVSHFAAILTILFTVGVGNVWGDTELFSTDFSSATWSSATFLQGNTTTADVMNGITFYSNSSTKQFSISEGELNFPDNNIASSNYFLAIPVTGVNGSITVTITNTVSSKSAWQVKYVVKQGTSVSTPGSTGTASTSGKTTTTFTVNGLTKSDYVVYIGRSSSNNEYKKIKTISITTPAPSCTEISPSLSYASTSLMVGDNSSAPTLNKDGSEGAVTWTSSNTDVATVNSSGVVTAVGAGEATITATIAANGNYCSGETTATITVNAAGGGGGDGDCTNCQVTIGISNSSKYTSSFTSSSTNSNITAEAKTFTAGSKISSSSSEYDKATAPYSLKYKPSSKISTNSYNDSYSVSAQFTVKTGYLFKPTAISATIVAEATSYTYQAILTDGTTTYASNEITTSASNQKITFEFPSFTGNGLSGNVTFKIWFKSEANNQKFFVVNLPITITGEVCPASSTPEPETYSITYECDEATSGCPSTATEQTALPNPLPSAPVKTGYTFDGWYTDADKNTPAVAGATLSANTTLYAKWTANQYDITYKDQGNADFSGTHGANYPTKHIYGTATTLVAPTKANYEFGGWYTNSECTGSAVTSLGATAYTANTTLYAQWECTEPTNVAISGEYVHFPGETLTLTVSGNNLANNATYTWKKGGQVIAGQTTATLTINETTIENAGNYTCTISNGGSCEATANFTVKMYSLRGLIDWSTDCSFTKVNATTATYSMELAGNSSYYFKVYDGSVYYGNTGGNPTMTSANCTNWTMQENMGNNVTLQTTFAGTYTFTLDYTDASNPKISVAYPQKQMVYLNPNMWDAPNATEVYTIYSWNDSESAFATMTKVNECENIYQAEINIAHTQLLFIRGGQAYNSWDGNRWNQSIDLTCQADGLYTIDAWDNTSNLIWKDGALKSWASGPSTYTPATYSITFNGNGNTGGSMTNVTGITCGGSATLTQNAFTRTGYTFAGWATAADGEKVYADKATISNITSDINLYAKWTPNANTAYTVKHYKQQLDGTYSATPDETDNLTGTTAASVTPSVKSYTGFTAPSTQTVTIAADGSTVVEYQYTRNSYKVTWNPAGGNWNDNTDNIVQTYEYGAKIIAPEKPSRTGYEFAQWAPTYVANETTMPAENVTYTAQWEEIAQTYTINYNLGPEKWATGYTPASTYTAGTEYTLPTDGNLTNENYGTFQGWYESADFQGNKVTSIPTNATGDKTYYAKWEYEIKFFEVVDEETDVVNKEFTNPLEGSYPTTYTYGIGITLPELPAKDGYTAAGWYSQWCVYYEETNGLGWVDACKSTALASDAYGNVNFAVKYTPTDDATDCPSSGTLYTAVAAATENISIAGNTTDLELNVSTHKTTVTGGSMYVTSQQGEAKNLITSKGFAMTNNNTFFKISMDCELQEGDIISIEVGNDGANERGVWVSSATSRPNSQPECALTATNASLVPVTYTVTQSDEYNGKKVLYIYRATANSTYFNNINISRPVTCTTPAAPTSPTNGETTSNSQAISWTDTSNDAWEVYLSTSSSTPGEGQSPTAEPTTASYTFTGLTASTTYYWWVRSVCDASHKSAWVAGNSFTTNTAAATPMVKWNLNVGTSATTTIFSSGDSDDHTNIPVANITVDQTNDGANGAGASNRTTKLALATGESAASVDNPDKYELFTFKVACGKKLTPSEVKIKVANVGSTAGGNQNYKAVLSDAYGHSISNTFTGTKSDGTVEEFSITNGGGTYFQGDVTLKLWSCKGASGNASAFRMGTPVEIYGTIEEGSTPTATITWNTQPADGQVGSADFAYAVSCSDGSAVTVTSADPSIATIVDDKLHYVAAGTTHLVASATDACGNEITQNSNDFTVTAASVDPNPGTGTETCITFGSNDSQDIKSDGTATVGNYTITASGINWQNTSAKIDNDNDYIIITNSTGITAANVTAKSNILFVTYSSSIDGTESKTTEEVTATNDFTELTLDVPNGTKYIKLQRENGGSSIYVSEICLTEGSPLPSCTTPVLSDLEAKRVCPGSDVTWTAIVNNTATLQENGETITYQWTKNSTVLSNDATLTLNDITEAAGGTYVVTATVSADGKASATATKEVTLTVTPATATPAITASAPTVFAGNSVTLTASCLSSGVTYQWYTCNDAEGNGESAIDNADAAAYTLTAGAAGTYYYKVIVEGDGTNSCGTAEKVYTLVVSASNSGETTCGEIKGQFTTGAYTFDTDFIIYGINSGGNLDEGASSSQGTICGGSGNYFGKQRFVVTFPVDVLSFSFIGYQSNLRTVKAVKTTTDLKTADTEYTTITHTAEVSQEGNCQTHVITPETAIPANTFVWVELSTGLNISEICYVPVSTADCTDPQVTATVNNATICAGAENVTFTATNYANGAEFQWQKKDGNTWEEINGATSATYTISSVTTAHAGQYRVIAQNVCNRISEEVTLTVLTAPTFNTFATTASVMKGNALAISDVQATNATGYAWYKSSDNSLDAAEDTKVGTSKDLLLAAASIPEAADQTFYLFCVASNSCGTTESQAITVTVTPFVEEECATKGNEGDHEFGFTNTGCGDDTYGDSKTPVWKTKSRDKYLTYTAPEGRYFATAKVTVAHTGGTKCGYAYFTNGGTTWVVEELDGLSETLTAITIELPANVTAFRISRNLTAQDGEKGSDSGTFYLAEACFTYKNACTATTLTPDNARPEYTMGGDADFTEPTFTLKAGETPLTPDNGAITYSSSNTAIATVESNGNVHFEGMTGSVTITATFAGGKISETEYCACQGSYTITVGCTDRAPEIVAAAGTNLNGCNNSITLEAKMEGGTTSFTEGTFQWYRDGEAIEGATSASYIVVRAGTYTVSRTHTCTTMSSNSAVVTNENVEPEVERLTPFQYYHVDKTYSDQMKDRHLFAVKSYGILDGKRYHLTATKNGKTTLNLSSSNAFFTIPSSDNAVDTVMINLNELKEKYAEGDEIVITCAPINSCNNASAITASITIHVIDQTPTLALICSGAEGEGTRETANLVVGGDFLTGYNKADLCQQTGAKTFDPNTEWGFYTELKEKYIVTPVNGYAEFNKLNYEPFDILLLTDYPKASKSEAAATILDDMAALCDYRPLLSLKAHMVAKTPSKWAAKGFTTSPVVPATTSQYANIVCYAHPMFDNLDDAHVEGIYHDHDDFNQLVYQILTGPGHESSKGLQGFELKDADNFVTIGLIHYNAAAAVVTHDNHTHLEWTPAADDRQLVAIAERQANIEARMILFAINCGAQSMQTPMGRQVLLTCLDYLLKTDLIEVADCRLTFDNGEGNTNWDESAYEGTGTKGDGLWSTAANWGPGYNVVPGRNNDVRIAAPCTVDAVKTKVLKGEEEQIADAYFPEVLSIHITKDGSLTIPANSSLTARSTILRADEDGNVYPTNVEDISLGSNEGGNASLILNNERGDTKAGVAMYSKAKADTDTYSEAASTWQYIGTPHSDVQNAVTNYYNSWLYQYRTESQSWEVIPNGGPLEPFRGYCITHPEQGHTYWMEGTLAATTNQDITIPANKFVVVANSWTAPIQIHELTDDDMEGLTEKTIYFFNTGSDPEGTNSVTQNATGEARWAAGTYISVPIHAADYTGEDTNIPSMQGFYVVGGGADGTLHLDYERHVRASRKNTPSGPMHAPARRVAADNEPQVAKFLFRGTRYDDRLIILERPDFTRGYDSGWDGEQWGGNAAAPMSYVVTETRWDAVSAIPEYEGTVIAFRAGEDSEYTIHFDYDGMEDALYLLDTDTQIYTRVLKGNSYTFTCTDKAEHNRFILTRKAPQIATGTEHINTGENAKAVKFIKDDKIFIFVNGMLYDATGKMVIR